MRSHVDRRLDARSRSRTCGTSATPSQRVDERRDRLVPQGFRAPERGLRARMGVPLRVGQLPREGVAQRQADRREHRRLRARSSSSRAASSGAGRTGSWCAWTPSAAITDFPPAGLNTDGVPTGGWWNYSGIQREVYLKKLDTVDFRKVAGPPGARRAAPATRRSRRGSTSRTSRGSGQRATITGKFGNQNLRLGTKTIGPDGIMEFADNITRPQPAPVGAGSPNLYDVSFTVRVGGQQGRGLRAQERHPLDQGLQRPPDPQRAGAQHARARPARGLQGTGLRDRQRAPRGARRPGQGARRDDRCARTTRCTPTRTSWPTAGPADLVGDPGLHDQDAGPQGAVRAAAGGRGAAPQHRGQREPPVGDAVVDRQRAVLAARPGAGLLHQRRGQVRQGDGPDAAGRDRGRRVPELALPGRAVQVDRRARAQRLLRLVPRPERPDLRPHQALRPTSTRCAPATRTRR